MSEWDDYESGPYCRHWSDEDCEIRCATCGHRCIQHWFNPDAGGCSEKDCECKEWKEPA